MLMGVGFGAEVYRLGWGPWLRVIGKERRRPLWPPFMVCI